MVDTHALGACAARRGGSTPFIRTNFYTQKWAFANTFATTLMYPFVHKCILLFRVIKII